MSTKDFKKEYLSRSFDGSSKLAAALIAIGREDIGTVEVGFGQRLSAGR
jgi:hypothetical protein